MNQVIRFVVLMLILLTCQGVILAQPANPPAADKAKRQTAIARRKALAAKNNDLPTSLQKIWYGKRLKAEAPMSTESLQLIVDQTRSKTMPKIWDMDKLNVAPAIYPAPEHDKEGVKAIFFENEPYQGKPSRVFAYYGLPAIKEGEKVPGMVLVHGGGGTAFEQWVRLWNQRGYAAIAIDWNGTLPIGEHPDRPRHEWAGPSSLDGCSFGQLDQPLTDQWAYHAVAGVIRSHSLLRSLPGVDPERIGISGISWGGYLTSIVSGVDHRFKFAIPVYGCGFIQVSSSMKINQLLPMPETRQQFWLEHWEPSLYLGQATLPMLWLNGTNDLHYHLPAFALSSGLAPGTVGQIIRPLMGHSHEHGWAPEEIYAFADAQCKGATPLISITETTHQGNRVSVSCAPQVPAQKAELIYTLSDGFWPEREWLSMELPLDATGTRAEAQLPKGAKYWFFNLTDQRGLLASSPLEPSLAKIE